MGFLIIKLMFDKGGKTPMTKCRLLPSNLILFGLEKKTGRTTVKSSS